MIRRGAALFATWLAALTIALWQPLASGFRLGFGDRVDAMIEISLLEHWRNVLQGWGAWDRPAYFWPHAATLGYNDGYLLSGLIYAAWRAVADPFVADTLTAGTWKSIGFFASHWLVARTLRWERGVALLIAALVTIASGMTVQAVHAQLQTVALVPLAMILACGAGRAAGKPIVAASCAAALAVLIAAWLLTAYYMAWFAIWFGCLFAACWLWTHRRVSTRGMIDTALAGWPAIVASFGTFAFAALPFLLVYLPKAAETGEHDYWTMLGYLVTPPFDLVNVGPDNLVWGWIWRGLMAAIGMIAPADAGLPGRVLGGEHSSGFPLFIFALIAVAAWRALRRPASPDLRAYALAIVIGWALTIQLWVLSPWGLVFFVVPGAAGLRVVSRFQLFLILPALLLAGAIWRARLLLLWWERRRVAIGLIALLIAEQINLAPVAALDRNVQRRALFAIPPPPPQCRSFYVVAARVGEPIFRNPERHGILAHNVDAMMLAERWRVPTLNGYATFRPRDWDMAAPLAPDYDGRMLRYARAHALRAVCRLDVRDEHPWRMVLQ